MSTAPRHAPRAPRTPFALLVLGLIGGGLCALLALNTASAANELTRHDLASRDDGLAARVADLQNAVAASAAPANLAAAAGRLGMVPAGNPAFLVVGTDGSVHLLGSPAAATGYPAYVPPHARTHTKTHPKTHTKTKPKTARASGTRHAATPSPSAADRSRSSPRTSSAPRTPTATPTPNTTLPGGNR